MKIGRDNENAEQYIARMIREHERRCHLFGGSVTITKEAETGNTVAIQPQPDSITINGVTITRQQWEFINQHGTWDAFVAANSISEPTKPTSKYPVGSWVVPVTGDARNGKVFMVTNSYYNNRWWYCSERNKIECPENLLRPAVREDFMAVFLGIKVWMERHSDGVWEYYLVIGTNGRIGGRSKIQAWQANRNRAAGVIEMPEGYWEAE